MQKSTNTSIRLKAGPTLAALLLALLAGAADLSRAQSYPIKPIQIVVPFAPGGVTDLSARMIGERLRQHLGQPGVVIFKEGAGTVIGTEYAARSAADGYTILVGNSSTVIASMGKNVSYDLQRDLAPVALYYAQPGIVMVHPSVRINSIKELIVYAKAKPGDLRYSSSGIGTVVHYNTELFAMTAGISMTHVPYRGGAPAITALISGEVDMMFLGINTAAPHVKSGKLRAIGVTTRERVAVFPDVPALAEQGLPGFDLKTWYALFVPVNTPKSIIDRLQGVTNSIVAEREFSERLAANGGKAVFASSDELRALVDRELKGWAKVIKAANIKLE